MIDMKFLNVVPVFYKAYTVFIKKIKKVRGQTLNRKIKDDTHRYIIRLPNTALFDETPVN